MEKSANDDKIILPRGLIPKVVLEDFTNISHTVQIRDNQVLNVYSLCGQDNPDIITLYDGKLILLKLQANSNNSVIEIYKTISIIVNNEE